MPETLASKLKNSGGLLIGLAQVFTQDYFNAIAEMLNDEHFETVYQADIPRDDKGDCILCRVLYEASQSQQKAQIFYRILVEPFVTMKGVSCYDTRNYSGNQSRD